MNFNSKYLIIAVVIFVIGVVAGVSAGFALGKKQGVEIGKQEAKKENEAKIAELNKAIDFFVPPLPNEIFAVSGEIKSIEGNIISLEIISLSERNLPGKELKKEIRKVIVDDKTEVVKIDFSAPLKIVKSGEPLQNETKIKFSELKAGDRITAIANENIKEKQEFIAAKIQLQILPGPR